MRWSRLVPVAMLGVLSVAYVLQRDALFGRAPLLAILEFPIGVAVLALLLSLALRPAARPVPPPEWRRHEQIVRQLSDPAEAPIASLIERYIATGEGAGEVAAVLDPDAVGALGTELSTIHSRRKRESKINQIVLEQGA